MSEFSIEHLPFNGAIIDAKRHRNPHLVNWPVVYTIDNADTRRIYIGETLNAVARMHQHLENPQKQEAHFSNVRVILDDTFNKSVCLDLESSLIRWFAGDGKFEILNRNIGVTDADYYERQQYRQKFRDIFERLRDEGLFEKSIPEIENSDLFKLSPFKALTHDQAFAVEHILEGLSADRRAHNASTIVVQGDPGTGKTVVAIYLLKLLRDIGHSDPEDVVEANSLFTDFFLGEYGESLTDMRIGMVIPQQSLRASIKDVFHTIPGLNDVPVLSPFEVGEASERFDLLVVDEAHRLGQRANQPSGVLNAKFSEINERLFGSDELRFTQLDWVRKQSDHQILFVDAAQSIRPADLPTDVLADVIASSRREQRHYALESQLRIKARPVSADGLDYVDYVHRVLSDDPPAPQQFTGYDVRFFDDLGSLYGQIRRREQESGLARLVAGFAWNWISKKNPGAFDIELDGLRFRWNTTPTDWINSPHSIEEVGSIHTVQGYDLNYAGVIIGCDLQYDPVAGRLVFSRVDYRDKKGKENNPRLGINYSDADLLKFVVDIYAVLLTRGMQGTYVYVCDPALREYLRPFFAPNERPPAFTNTA